MPGKRGVRKAALQVRKARRQVRKAKRQARRAASAQRRNPCHVNAAALTQALDLVDKEECFMLFVQLREEVDGTETQVQPDAERDAGRAASAILQLHQLYISCSSFGQHTE